MHYYITAGLEVLAGVVFWPLLVPITGALSHDSRSMYNSTS